MIIGEKGDYQINIEEFENFQEDVTLFIHDKSNDSYTTIDTSTPFNFSSNEVFEYVNRFNLVVSMDSTLGIGI
jgi:hypothetical protein